MLQAFTSYQQDDWDTYPMMLEFAYNNSKQTSMQMSPFHMNYGYGPRTCTQLSNLYCNVKEMEDFLLQLKTLNQQALDALHHVQKCQEHYVNLHRTNVTFSIGTQVLLLTAHLNTATTSHRMTKKLQVKYLGP